MSGTSNAALGAGAAHPAAVGCSSCHLGGDDAAAFTTTRLVAAQEILCVKCHARAVEVSHPSGFTPRRSLPAAYPLDWKGDLTCSTCHLTHGRERGLLRGNKRAKALCLDCHDQAFFNNMKDAGTSLVISGHLDVSHGRNAIDIDAHSLHCLGCHAGGHSAGGSVSVSRNGILRHSSGSAPHPIGRSYRDASRKGGFHPEQQLAQKKIMLSDGKISCVSCHEAYKKDHGKLVATLDRSALCLACHAR
ncbi:MAG: cytochrome c3 family protein [Betaproteobacteria bacterium]|nr:cytochrome c3 family protein [Betaproteobacteria bacterium]